MVPKYIIHFSLSRSWPIFRQLLQKKSHLNIIQYKEETEMSRPLFDKCINFFCEYHILFGTLSSLLLVFLLSDGDKTFLHFYNDEKLNPN